MTTKINWAIWSGEGERGTREIKTATLLGIKRILTQERCSGDRWAYACPAHWPQAQYAGSARECDIDRMAAGQALGSISTPKKAASSRENGKKGGRPKAEEMTYELINDDGCLMASTRTTSFKKAREYFNDQYEGRYVILCGEIDDRRNVVLK